jgi:DNA modification methylase
MIKLATIKKNPNNPRVLRDEKFAKLVNSIKEFPKMMELRPMVVNDDDIVLGGNMRLKALAELGYKDIPDAWVKKASELTEEEQHRFIIADNVGFGDWDWEMLAVDWDVDKLTDWGLEMPELEVAQELTAKEDDYEMPDVIETDIVLGDLIEIGEHRLLCGDSTDSDAVAKLMDGEKADMVFTDPPYRVAFKGQRLSNTTKDGVEILHHKGANSKHDEIENDALNEDDFKIFMAGVLSNLFLFNNGGWYICFAYSELHLLMNSIIDAGYKWKNILIWMKNQATLSNMDYKSRYEPILYGQSGGKFYGERYKQEDIWEFQRTLKNDLHPTMKPIPLIENAINNSSKTGMIVLDIFLGSGSTMVAAHQLKRKCYGMELDPKYCQVIVDRMKQLDPNLTIKKNGEVI